MTDTISPRLTSDSIERLPRSSVVTLVYGASFTIIIDHVEIAWMCRKAIHAKSRRCKDGPVTIKANR